MTWHELLQKRIVADKKRTVRVAFPTPMGLRIQSAGGSKKIGGVKSTKE
jgi:hypothetical protein